MDCLNPLLHSFQITSNLPLSILGAYSTEVFLIGLFYLTITFLINTWCRFLIRSDKYSSQTKEEFILSCYSTRDETGLDFWQPISIPVPALSMDNGKGCRQLSPKVNVVFFVIRYWNPVEVLNTLVWKKIRKVNTIDWPMWNSY
jgi:hypothetical protein